MARYSIDAQGRAKQVIRKGHYADAPMFSVTYSPHAKGKLMLTAASRAIRQREDKTQHETYFLDWPLYQMLAKMPFSGLIQTGPAVAVMEQCIKVPR